MPRAQPQVGARTAMQPDPTSLPKVFGRYLLLRRLSRGGMGEIFLAKSGQLTGFEKLCVIKKIVPDLAEDREFIRRFIDEAQVAIQLQHANVGSVYEVGMVEGEYFLALEYVEGCDLRRTLSRLHERRQRMPVDLALYIVREVTSGLAYAHRRTDDRGKPLNLVHCDISPPNIVVSFEGEVKIIDFGIAKSALRISVTNPRIGFGKVGYMAPEQLVRGAGVDRRTDVYSTGVLLYELLTGERLIQYPEGTDYRSIARLVARGHHPLPGDRLSELEDFDPVVKRALAVDPDKRYASAEELRDAVMGRLARLNPTITADRLGGYMRQLFADEVAEERNWVTQASATDLSDFADEFTDARTHTVSFAVVSEAPAPTPLLPERSGTLQVRLPAGPESGFVAHRPRSRRWLVAGLAIACLAAGAGLAVLAVGRGRGGDRRAAAPAPPPFVVQPLRPPAAVPDASAVATTPAPAPAPDAGPAVASRPPPRPSPRPSPPRQSPPRRDPPPAPTAAEVQAKYQAVAREYSRFKGSFGPRLEREWNDILSFATYGGGDDKHRKLSARLDEMRRKMAAIRGGE